MNTSFAWNIGLSCLLIGFPGNRTNMLTMPLSCWIPRIGSYILRCSHSWMVDGAPIRSTCSPPPKMHIVQGFSRDIGALAPWELMPSVVDALMAH